MILFYIRHGDPIYNPNMLTPLGEKQAHSVAKRLASHGLDKIYSSPSTRARQTAQPTADLTKLPVTEVDFADEAHVWNDLTIKRDDGGLTWLFSHEGMRELFTSKEIRDLGDEWYRHPRLTSYEAGIKKVYDNVDAFLASLGYEHERYTGRYKVIRDNEERVALFAHQGFGLAFLSTLLDIPYPMFSTHFDMSHSNMTAIEFKDEGGITIPRVMTLSNDSHIYADGLPTKYNNEIYF